MDSFAIFWTRARERASRLDYPAFGSPPVDVCDQAQLELELPLLAGCPSSAMRGTRLVLDAKRGCRGALAAARNDDLLTGETDPRRPRVARP